MYNLIKKPTVSTTVSALLLFALVESFYQILKATFYHILLHFQTFMPILQDSMRLSLPKVKLNNNNNDNNNNNNNTLGTLKKCTII